MAAADETRDQPARPNKRAYEDNVAELARLAKQRKDIDGLAEAHRSKSNALAMAALYEEVLLQRDAHLASGNNIERLVRIAHAVHTFLTSKHHPVGYSNVVCALGFGDTASGDVKVDVNYWYGGIPGSRRRTINDKGVVFRGYDPVGNVLDTRPDAWTFF